MEAYRGGTRGSRRHHFTQLVQRSGGGNVKNQSGSSSRPTRISGICATLKTILGTRRRVCSVSERKAIGRALLISCSQNPTSSYA
jgi:hypothetical protein